MNTARITLLILAGGMGSRMGHADKGLLQLAGKPLAQHLATRFASYPVLLSANRHLELYAQLGFTVLPDADDSYAGPLAGVLQGLHHMHSDWLLTLPCDTPFIPLDLPMRLLTAAEQAGAKLAYVRTPVQTHPAVVLYDYSLESSPREFLASGQRKVGLWQQNQQAITVDFPDEQAFFNINTPADLQQAEQQFVSLTTGQPPQNQ